MGKSQEHTFHREAQTANKFMKRYTNSLITREIQIKATIKTKETNIKNSGSTVRGGEAVDHIFTAGGTINQPDHFRKLFDISGEDSYSLLLSNSPLKVIFQRNYCLAGDVQNVESSSVYKSNSSSHLKNPQEITHISTDGSMDHILYDLYEKMNCSYSQQHIRILKHNVK